jgi:hypothetical protein
VFSVELASNKTVFETLKYGIMIDSKISVDQIIGWAQVMSFGMTWLVLGLCFLPSGVKV